jgi:hypothetical protein
LNDIHGSASTGVVAVGEQGSVVRLDGSAWENEPTPTDAALLGVWTFPTGQAVAVGMSGTILRYDGSAWSEDDSRVSVDLYDCGGLDPTNVYAVGDNGTILHNQGSGWLVERDGDGRRLESVWTRLPDDVFVAGQDGLLLHWDGDEWAGGPGYGDWLYDLWAAGPYVYAAGGGAWVYDGVWEPFSNCAGAQALAGLAPETLIFLDRLVCEVEGDLVTTYPLGAALERVWGDATSRTYFGLVGGALLVKEVE